MIISFTEIIKLEEEAYVNVFSSNIWQYNQAVNNYNIDISEYCNLFNKSNDYFKLYKHDLREPLNIHEYYVYTVIKSYNYKSIFHTKSNYMILTRHKSYQNFHKILDQLEIKGYIKIERTKKAVSFYHSNKSMKLLVTKIYAVDPIQKKMNKGFFK